MGKPRSKRIVVAVATCLLASATIGACAAGQGSDTLRERLRARFQNSQPDAASSVTEKVVKPGDYKFTIEYGGMKRMYRIHVPASYSPSRPVPLLFSFHGGGGNMNYQADDKYYGFISKSEQAGYVAVFPNGYSRFPSGILATWNAGNCCGGARDKNIDDVGFVRQIVKNLKGQLNVDDDRIFATGMSNGALFSYRLACEMADTFRGIASVAGSDGTSECHPTRPVNILEIHAKNDEFVLFNGGAGKDSRMLADFVSVPETISRWVRRDGCDATPKRVLDQPRVYCERYSQCRENVKVEFCVTADGGHSWPGGRKVRTGEPGSTAMSATDTMWDFFMGK